MNITTRTDGTTPADLRGRLISQLKADGALRTGSIIAAMTGIPRHAFVPEATLEAAYADEVVITVTDEAGTAISSVSQPAIVALQLEQGRPRPGERVLEIGTGRGYNAALLGTLVGPGGSVTTVDIDRELVAFAQSILADLGLPHVHAYTDDGADGWPEHAPYDLIHVATGAADLPGPWFAQLADRGRLVVPMGVRGLSRLISFRNEGDHLTAFGFDAFGMGGFLPMRGTAAADPAPFHPLAGGALSLHTSDGRADLDALDTAWGNRHCEEWTGVTLTRTRDALPKVSLWLAESLDRYGLLLGPEQATEDFGWVWPMGSVATWDETGLAYTVLRARDGSDLEIGVRAVGPTRTALAADLAEALRTWDGDHRGRTLPVLRAWRGIKPAHRLPRGRRITLPHATLVLSHERPKNSSASV